ncbi:MAG: tRNA sulfurtransferase [Candidatus Thorarchaeota archaeon]
MTEKRNVVLVQPNLPETRESRQKALQFLERNLKLALEEHKVNCSEVKMDGDVIIIKGMGPDDILLTASQVFGVLSVSNAIQVEKDSKRISESVSLLMNDSFNQVPRIAIFHADPATDSELMEDIERKLQMQIMRRPINSIHSSPYTSEQYGIIIHLTKDFAYVFDRRIRGIGGLPSGYESHVVCMISSGLDSPVAAFKVIRRGCVPIFVYFDNSPFSDDSNKEIAIKQARTLSKYIYGEEVKMYIVPHGEDLIQVLEHAPRRMTCIFCRRNMYRLAQEVAFRENADAIVTGEIIGEQASQTTRNIYAENTAICDIPVIRPCIGDDKDEIIQKAREIGTYQYAEEAASCCSLPPRYPTIKADTREIPIAEDKIGEDWVKYAVSDAEIFSLKEGR